MYQQKTNILQSKCGQKYKNLHRLLGDAMKISDGAGNLMVVLKS